MIILMGKILFILKAPCEMKKEEEPMNLTQKSITFVSSSPDRALSKQDLSSSRFPLLTARQAQGPEISTYKIHVPAKTGALSHGSEFQKIFSEDGE